MKKALILLITLYAIVGLVVASSDTTPSSWISVKEYGSKNATTLTNMITKFGTRDARFVLDGGDWLITTNVTFPSNITVCVTDDSCLDITNNCIVRFNTNPLVAGPYLIFKGNGNATGTASFIYRWPDWGDTGQYDIGDGAIVTDSLASVTYVNTQVTSLSNEMVSTFSNYSTTVSITNNMADWMTNAYSDLYTDKTTLADDMTNAYPALDTNSSDEANTPFFFATKSTQQNIANGVITRVNFETEVTDTDGNYNGTNLYEVSQDGYYMVNARLRFTENPGSQALYGYIYTNGEQMVRWRTPMTADDSKDIAMLYGPVQLFTDDNVTIHANSDGSTNAIVGLNNVFFGIWRLAE